MSKEMIRIRLHGTQELLSKVCESMAQDENVLNMSTYRPDVRKVQSSKYGRVYIDYLVDTDDL